MSDISQVFEAGDILTRMHRITGFNSSFRADL